MPRQKKARGTTAAAAKKQAEPAENPNAKHGEPGYDPLKDGWSVGYQAGNYSISWLAPKLGKKPDEIDAYDFYANPATGLRPGEQREPASGSYINLAEDGVNERTVLPPLNVWKEGGYLFDLLDDPAFIAEANELPYKVKEELKKLTESALKASSPPAQIFAMYVVDGEGTPGNFVWRVYDLPKSVAGDLHPKHPLMWKEQDKRGKSTSLVTPRSGYGYSDYGTGVGKGTTQATKKSSSPTMPAGVRIRCACGHWFKQADLPGHATICPAMEKSGEADWAIMCCDECGCVTLDEASQCKPGFPREKSSAAEDAGESPDSPNGAAGKQPQEQLVTT